MRLIDVDELEKHYRRIDAAYNDEPWLLVDILSEMNDMPTVDAVPVVHGRWIEGRGSRYVCSVCNANAGLYGGGIGQNLSNYCPNCGARMDGGADNA